MDLSIVIVSYNVKPFLEQALHSIRKALKGISHEIFVVDNHSGDGSDHLVRTEFPEVHLILNQENRGFARATNQAIKKSSGEVICLINPDTLVQEDTFKVCLDYLKAHPETGAVGCRILNPDGSLQLACRRSFPTPWIALTKVTGLSSVFPGSRLFGKYNLTYLNPDETTEVDALSGSFMMIRRETIKDVGLLDEAFFLYGEDLDWCYRIKQKGWKVIYLPETQIIHYKGCSTREASFDSLRLFYNAMRLFVQKHFHRGWSFFPQWFLLLGIALRGSISFLYRAIKQLVIPLIDVIFIQSALLLALFIRFGHLRHWNSYRLVNVFYTLIWLGCLYLMGLYKKGIYSSSRAAGGVVFGLILNTSLTFFFPQYAFSRQVVLTAGLLNILFLAGWRLLIRFSAHSQHIPFIASVGKTLFRKRAVIIGVDQAGKELYSRLNHPAAGYEMIGFIGLDSEAFQKEEKDRVRILGTIEDIRRLVIVNRIHEVIFSPQAGEYKTMLNVIANAKDLHLDFKMVPDQMDVVIGRTSIDQLEDIPLMDLEYPIFTNPYRFLKRLIDLSVSVIMMPYWFPVYVYFRFHPSYSFQAENQKPVYMNQLMKDGKSVKNWRRNIPFFWEILKGRMSFVGSEINPHSGMRFACKPGLTGLVQVNSKVEMSDEEKERYHLYYLKNYSIFLDFEILIKSLFRL